MRLIDADALMADIKATIEDSGCVNHEGEIMDCIEYADTIDALPVVRGYSYEDDKTYSGPGTSNYICSVCGEMQGTWKKGLAQNQKFKFCPWCGAKMEDKPCE